MANEWNTSYPIPHTLISDVPGEIRKLKTSAKAQLSLEHEAPVDGDLTGSEHSSGSAVAYEGSSTPTTRPGGATLGDNAIDRGKLWLDDTYDPPILKRWDGSAWEIPMTLSFGARTTNDSESNTISVLETYKVGSDGFLTVVLTGALLDRDAEIRSDSGSTPTTVIARIERYRSGSAAITWKDSFMAPIRKDDYFKVVNLENADDANVTIYWLPIGAGTCVKQ